MQSASKNQIARLAALTLVFSYAELLLPRFIPFFRLGLGNAAILMALALGLSFPSFMLLCVVKTLAANVMAGTLFSPFFLVSLAQSLSSALLMFMLNFICQGKAETENSSRRALMSIYGISISGAAVSAVVQLALSSLYLGQGTWSLLGPMLLFNLISGIITAWLAEILGDYNKGGEGLARNMTHSSRVQDHLARTSLLATPSSGGPAPRNDPLKILWLALLLTAGAAVFFIKNVYVLCAVLSISLLAQKICGRKILLLPHISLWLFVLVTSVLVPNGRVLFSVLGFSITQGALFTGLQKALRLSAVSALSQCAVTVKPGEETILGLTLSYYKLMLDSFLQAQGSILTRLRVALSTEQVQYQQPEQSQNQKEEK